VLIINTFLLKLNLALLATFDLTISIFRYWLILNDALAYMRNANITAEDSTIVLTKGDDDPKIRKDSKNKVRLSV